MCTNEEREERIEMLATLFYWNCFDNVTKVLDWCQIKGFLNADECQKVIKRRDFIDHAEEYGNEHWRDSDEERSANTIRILNSSYGC